MDGLKTTSGHLFWGSCLANCNCHCHVCLRSEGPKSACNISLWNILARLRPWLSFSLGGNPLGGYVVNSKNRHITEKIEILWYKTHILVQPGRKDLWILWRDLSRVWMELERGALHKAFRESSYLHDCQSQLRVFLGFSSSFALLLNNHLFVECVCLSTGRRVELFEWILGAEAGGFSQRSMMIAMPCDEKVSYRPLGLTLDEIWCSFFVIFTW